METTSSSQGMRNYSWNSISINLSKKFVNNLHNDVCIAIILYKYCIILMSISLSGYFSVLGPDTGDRCAIFWVECARTFDIVCFEVTIEFLSVRYVQHPSSILWIINKLSYIML